MSDGRRYRRRYPAIEAAIAFFCVSDRPGYRRHALAIDVAIAAFFMLLDTGLTLVGSSWWPAHPGPLAWAMLGLQAAACASLVFRRRAPVTGGVHYTRRPQEAFAIGAPPSVGCVHYNT